MAKQLYNPDDFEPQAGKDAKKAGASKIDAAAAGKLVVAVLILVAAVGWFGFQSGWFDGPPPPPPPRDPVLVEQIEEEEQQFQEQIEQEVRQGRAQRSGSG